jgi:hypothetical protein
MHLALVLLVLAEANKMADVLDKVLEMHKLLKRKAPVSRSSKSTTTTSPLSHSPHSSRHQCSMRNMPNSEHQCVVYTQALCPNVIPDAFRGVSSNLGLLSLCVTEEQRKRGKAFLAEQTEADTDVSPRTSLTTRTD